MSIGLPLANAAGVVMSSPLLVLGTDEDLHGTQFPQGLGGCEVAFSEEEKKTEKLPFDLTPDSQRM